MGEINYYVFCLKATISRAEFCVVVSIIIKANKLTTNANSRSEMQAKVNIYAITLLPTDRSIDRLIGIDPFCFAQDDGICDCITQLRYYYESIDLLFSPSIIRLIDALYV